MGGFARAHTWMCAEHNWWQLIPRPVDAPTPAGGARLGFDVSCRVLQVNDAVNVLPCSGPLDIATGSS
jgi:hypothetical protein